MKKKKNAALQCLERVPAVPHSFGRCSTVSKWVFFMQYRCLLKPLFFLCAPERMSPHADSSVISLSLWVAKTMSPPLLYGPSTVSCAEGNINQPPVLLQEKLLYVYVKFSMSVGGSDLRFFPSCYLGPNYHF